MAGDKEYAREVREWRKEHRICVRCGKQDVFKNRIHCLQCLMDLRECSRNRYKGSSEEKRLKAKEIRDLKKANGICLQCSKLRYKEHAYCYEHYISQKKAHKKIAQKKYNYYGELGLCRICGKPRYEGHKLCKEHYEVQVERMRKINRERKALQEQYRVLREKGIFHERTSVMDGLGIHIKNLEVWEFDGKLYTVTIIDGRVTHVDYTNETSIKNEY